jgi:sporulation protein YlmC with PRC-barrel domain
MLKSLSLSAPLVVLAGGLAFAATNSISSLSSTNHRLMSDIFHASVYDTQNNKIGQIDDLVLNSDGQIKTAVIGVGGFLGVGQKDVAIPYSDLKVSVSDGKDELTLDRTKDQLKAAPAYDKTASAS